MLRWESLEVWSVLVDRSPLKTYCGFRYQGKNYLFHGSANRNKYQRHVMGTAIRKVQFNVTVQRMKLVGRESFGDWIPWALT